MQGPVLFSMWMFGLAVSGWDSMTVWNWHGMKSSASGGLEPSESNSFHTFGLPSAPYFSLAIASFEKTPLVCRKYIDARTEMTRVLLRLSNIRSTIPAIANSRSTASSRATLTHPLRFVSRAFSTAHLLRTSTMADQGAWGAWQVAPSTFTKSVVSAMRSL